MQMNTKITCSLKENTWSGLILTNAAIQQIRYLMASDSKMLGLRLSIKESGCAGFSYVIGKVIESHQGDLLYKYDGARLFVPLKAMPFIDGTELDYVEEGLNHVFKFNNPKAQYTCGCGESFGLI